MDKLDYSLSMLWHDNAVEYYGNPMAMNVACMITNLLYECNNCESSEKSYIEMVVNGMRIHVKMRH